MTNTELKKIKIFDTTLRDGEQSPGAAMTHEEKLGEHRATLTVRVICCAKASQGRQSLLARRATQGEKLGE